VRVYAKAEWYNPGGSVKDRPAAAILKDALETERLSNGQIFLDSTSGNMGISYATFCAALGIPLQLAIPSNASPERLIMLRALGADLTLTDPLEGSDGARLVAMELYQKDPQRFFFADQYGNPENWKSHYHSTGPEILSQLDEPLTHFVAGLGTSGTLMGTGRYLKEFEPEVSLVAVQPDGPLHGLEGLKHMESSPKPEIFDATLPDLTRFVRTEDAYRMVRRMAIEEGLLVGPSAGAAMAATLSLGAGLEKGVIVVLLPDSASKYFNSPLWRDDESQSTA
jgi:cysteine synthase B